MSMRRLQAAFESWRREQLPLVLASVYETHGSTYSKAGARMLITGDGRFQGMLSGGCLEGDLAERALAVLRSGNAQTVSYDLGRSDEELWGMGVGCDGLMRIFLQPLLPRNDYQPFSAMAEILAGDIPAAALTVIDSKHPSVTPGATQLLKDQDIQSFGVPSELQSALTDLGRITTASRQSGVHGIETDGQLVEILAAVLLPPPRILILGAGLDAEPVLRLTTEMGWRATVQDHRAAYIDSGAFAAADRVMCEPAERLAAQLDLDRFDAVIVMSHHLATDRVYLQALSESSIPYVGLLGPPDRRRRLLADLGPVAESLQSRLHGPAGFDIGAEGPAPIALSIVAQMHDQLKKARRI